jgi:hypothetical protein
LGSLRVYAGLGGAADLGKQQLDAIGQRIEELGKQE